MHAHGAIVNMCCKRRIRSFALIFKRKLTVPRFSFAPRSCPAYPRSCTWAQRQRTKAGAFATQAQSAPIHEAHKLGAVHVRRTSAAFCQKTIYRGAASDTESAFASESHAVTACWNSRQCQRGENIINLLMARVREACTSHGH